MIDREHRELVGRLRNRWGQDVPSLCNDAADVIERLAIAQSGTQPGLIEAAEWHEKMATMLRASAHATREHRGDGGEDEAEAEVHEVAAKHFRSRAADRSA